MAHRRSPARRGDARCDVCGGVRIEIVRRARDLERDLARTHAGLDRVTLDDPVDIDRCEACGTLHRRLLDPTALEASYRDEQYETARAAALHDRMLDALRRDAPWLRRHGVRSGARLLEVGSYVGAFLDFAAERGSAVTGVDPNASLVTRCTRRGRHAVCSTFDAFDGDEGTYDGVWILNCFEQLPDLDRTVRHAGDLLRPGGTLVLRTPNADFAAFTCRHAGHRLVREVADANAVLGMPFRRCLSVTALEELLTRHGFATTGVRGHELSVLAPFGRSPLWRWSAAVRRALFWSASAVRRGPTHPWIDVVATRVPAGAIARG